MDKIVITGGLGNLGSVLARKLVEEGYQVIIYDSRKDIESVKDISSKIEIIHNDIRDFESLTQTLIGAIGVVHLAAVSRVVWGYDNPRECTDINVQGTTNVLEAARISVRKPWIIFGSSREVYGEPEVLPCNESSPKKIVNIYGTTKIAGELLLEQYHRNYGISGLILRFSNVYGSKYDQLDRVIPKFMIRASKGLPLIMQGGDQIFDFTHISDTIDGIIAGIDYLITNVTKEKAIFDDFHVVTGKPTHLKRLTEYIDEFFINAIILDHKSKRVYDVEKFYGDPSKAKEILNFQAKIDVKEGLKLLLKELEDKLGSVNPLREKI